MNVRELIEHLQEYDGDLMVVTDGYEGGANEIKTTEIRKYFLYRNGEERGWYGNHEPVEHYEDPEGSVDVLYMQSMRDKVGNGNNSNI